MIAAPRQTGNAEPALPTAAPATSQPSSTPAGRQQLQLPQLSLNMLLPLVKDCWKKTNAFTGGAYKHVWPIN